MMVEMNIESCSKRRFKSENEARKERGWAESEYNQKFNIYRCGDCNDWHLASIK